MKRELEHDFRALGNFSPGELKQFRETFTAELKQYRATERRYAWPILVIILAGFAMMFFSFLLFQHPINWLVKTGIVFVFVGIILIAFAASSLQRKLKCPACHNPFMDGSGERCPECGSASVEPPNWLGTRHCNYCGKDLRTGRNRSFRYKACTHCGLFLDEKGL
jgi:hypothetical protein